MVRCRDCCLRTQDWPLNRKKYTKMRRCGSTQRIQTFQDWIQSLGDLQIPIWITYLQPLTMDIKDGKFFTGCQTAYRIGQETRQEVAGLRRKSGTLIALISPPSLPPPHPHIQPTVYSLYKQQVRIRAFEANHTVLFLKNNHSLIRIHDNTMLLPSDKGWCYTM